MSRNKKSVSTNNENKLNVKLYLAFALGVTLIFGIYRAVIYMVTEGMIDGVWFSVLMWTYLLLGCAAFIAIYVLNRGFSSKPLKPEELPSDWNHVQKAEYMTKDVRRRRIAKYIMIPFIAFIFVFFWEIVEIYYLPIIKEWYYSF